MSAYATQLSELSKQNMLEETLRQHDKAVVLAEKLAALLADVDAVIADYRAERWDGIAAIDALKDAAKKARA